MIGSRFLSFPIFLSLGAGSISAQLQAPKPVLAKIDFATDIQPLLRENCVECHGPDKQRAGLRIDRKSSVLKFGSRRVVPGSSANSMIYHRLAGNEYGHQMPPDGALKPDQIALVKSWIDQGAEWPDAMANEVDLPGPDPKAVVLVDELRAGDLAAFMKGAEA